LDDQPNNIKIYPWFEKTWRGFCRLVVLVFYRRLEVGGCDNLPDNRGIILCANHTNALADAVIIQAATDRAIRPLARSGLFKNPLLRPVLKRINAVPVYRRQDSGSNTKHNADTFSRCHEMLAANQVLIIFPEGQSHDEPQLTAFKTGAARMALGAAEKNGHPPAVVPVGLTFPTRGNFRSDALIQFGEAIKLPDNTDTTNKQAVLQLTEDIRKGIEALTLNADSWEDINLMARLERFFALRHGRYHHRNLKQKFRAQQRLIETQRLLRKFEPDRVRSLIKHLKNFERLCQFCGIRDYQLTIILMLLIVFPTALWGILNSLIPYQLTRQLSRIFARGANQYDTTKIVLGMVFFSFFWGIQSFLVYQNFGLSWTALYLVSVLAGSAVALAIRGEKRRILDNIRVFFVFMRKRDLKQYLQQKRQDLEVELAKLVRIAKRLPGNLES
jgi:1-acyl-sn-glycerol-3-phosphate acyltransferase